MEPFDGGKPAHHAPFTWTCSFDRRRRAEQCRASGKRCKGADGLLFGILLSVLFFRGINKALVEIGKSLDLIGPGDDICAVDLVDDRQTRVSARIKGS